MEKLKRTSHMIDCLNEALLDETQKRLDNLTKPQGSLGRLEEIAKRLVAITGQRDPDLSKKMVFTLAADHGITEEKISAFPKEVTAQMVYNFVNGGAAVNVLAKHAGSRIIVADFGVAAELKIPESAIFKNRKIASGTRNFKVGAAMSRQEAVLSVEKGIELLEDSLPLGIVGTGEMGIGNTTSAAAMAAVFTQRQVKELVGRGTGLDDAGLKHKIGVIEEALKLHLPDPRDPIGVLEKVGGFEIGGMAGIMLASASHRIPVVIDGFISGAAALLACQLKPEVKEYMFASHCSTEPGHRLMLEHLGLEPILDLRMRLGEGTGSCLAFSLIEASAKILSAMATFSDAKVSEKSA
jgi:nicotinate-nucleotide--dimethylbenzimidazole phosphoribosyltransferase